MATVNKDFKVKNGLIVEGASATVDNYDVLTKKPDDQNYIVGLIGGTSTSAATPNTVVKRDENADFAAGTITADLVGNVEGNVTGNLTGDVTGTVSDLSNHTTSDLAEGTNKYYTDARVHGAVSVESSGPLTYNSTSGVFDLATGTGLKVDTGNLVIDETVTATHTWVTGAIDALTTSDIEEGSRLYYTDARARDAISVDGGLAYNSVTGVVSADLGNGLQLDTNGKIEIDDTVVATETDLSNAISDHNVASGVHGVTGDVVGTTDIQTLTNKVLSTGTSLNADLDANNNKIVNLGAPTADTDAATKLYVDTLAAQGLRVKDGVDVATTDTLAVISGGTVTYANGTDGVGATLTTTGSFATIDSKNLALYTEPIRILVKNEANAAHNGIYVLANSTAKVMTRDVWFDSDADVQGGDFVFVVDGTINGGSGWVQTNTVNIIGTDNIVFAQFSGAGTYTAGNGITLLGTEFSIDTAVTATNQYVANAVGDHSDLTTGVHGVSGDVVGTTDTQELTNKTFGNGSVLGANLDAVNTYTLVNLPEPTANQQAATKFYVDDAISTVTTNVGNLTTNDVAEADNLYFTNARAVSALSSPLTSGTQTNISVTYNSLTDKFDFVAENGVADSTTDNLSEGTNNLYFTTSRAKEAAVALLTGTETSLTNIQITANMAGGLDITAENGVADSTTDDLAEGTSHLYFTNQRAVDALEAVVPNFTEVDLNSVATQIAATTGLVETASTVTAYAFAKASYRSAEFLVKVAYGSHTEISKVLLTLDTSDNIAVTEYAIVGTNGSASDITADVSGTEVRLRVATVHNNSTVSVVGTLLV